MLYAFNLFIVGVQVCVGFAFICLTLTFHHFSSIPFSPLLPLPYLQIEGDEGGYDEEYPLEGLDINTNDFMAKVSVGDFRRNWEEVSKVH
jgi:hypothetical protein